MCVEFIREGDEFLSSVTLLHIVRVNHIVEKVVSSRFLVILGKEMQYFSFIFDLAHVFYWEVVKSVQCIGMCSFLLQSIRD